MARPEFLKGKNFTVSEDVKFAFSSDGTLTLRLGPQFARRHKLVHRQICRLKATVLGDGIVEFRPTMASSVAGRPPNGTSSETGYMWGFAGKSVAQHVKAPFDMQQAWAYVHASGVEGEPPCIYADLTLATARDANAPAQEELPLDAPVLLSEATLAQVAERLMELASE